MNDIPIAAIERAYELSYAGQPRFDTAVTWAAMSRTSKAFARFISEVSEIAKLADEALADTGYLPGASGLRARIGAFILPDELDDLAAAVEEAFMRLPPLFQGKTMAENVAKVFAERGLKIVKDEQ